jgi:hypothetical protein
MADPLEDKSSLAERLEEDRQKMAIQVSELKKDYNVPHRLSASVQKYPWQWLMGAVLTGFLLSRLPARRKEVYLWSDYLGGPHRNVPPVPDRDAPGNASKVWSFAQPVISAYLARELYRNVRRPNKHASHYFHPKI